MRLTRRDAVVALAALGGGTALAVTQYDGDVSPPSDDSATDDPVSDTETPPTTDHVRATFVAVARVVYPDAVEGIEEFVTTFLDGRLADEAHAEELRRVVAELDERAEIWHDGQVTDLPAETVDQLLRETGADHAEEAPDGTTAERVRYYVVNELLLALYTSPTGGSLAGIENPIGHPGGAESYTQGPR
jgi:hypothetical protein